MRACWANRFALTNSKDRRWWCFRTIATWRREGASLPERNCKPSAEGVRIYLDVGDALDPVLNRVPAAGGSISKPRTALPPGMGSYAHIIDSEGNCVGLHAAA